MRREQFPSFRDGQPVGVPSAEDREAAPLGQPVHAGLDRGFDLAINGADVLIVLAPRGICFKLDRFQ
jgi:hypothetical protein